jgi:lysophospholipase L1-like esterase
MLHHDLELHNFAEIEPWAGYATGALQRIPRRVADQLSPRGRFIALESAGSEIRFVTEAPTAHLYLGSLHGTPGAPHAAAEVLIYRGDFRHDHVLLTPGLQTCIELNIPEKLANLPPEVLRGRRFSANVWRIFFERSRVALHHLDAHGYAVRPPAADEKPSLRWLAYGSSITNGSAATRHVNSYVQQAAWRLGVDVINQGMSGACAIEPAMVDWLASRHDWDFATCELGINLLNSIDAAEFRRRATHLVETLRARHPAKPLALITHFTFEAHLKPAETAKREKADAFDTALRDLAAAHGLALIEGRSLLADACGLSTDLIHPADHGMFQMGETLATALRAAWPGLPLAH